MADSKPRYIIEFMPDATPSTRRATPTNPPRLPLSSPVDLAGAPLTMADVERSPLYGFVEAVSRTQWEIEGCPPNEDGNVESMAEKIAHTIEADLLRGLTDAVLADAVRPDADGMVTMHTPTDAEAAEMDALFAEDRR